MNATSSSSGAGAEPVPPPAAAAPTPGPVPNEPSAPAPVPSPTSAPAVPAEVTASVTLGMTRWLAVGAAVLTALSTAALVIAWNSQQRQRSLEAELVRRQQDSGVAAGEARAMAQQAEVAARESAAKVTLLEARVAETAMQRSQFEELIQSLARSRDENVLADMEAALRVAQQQSALTGSADPLVQVLRQSDERLARYNQPRLERVRRAVNQDLERIRALAVTDVAGLTSRLDELTRQVDEWPLLATPLQPGTSGGGALAAAAAASTSAAAPRPAGHGAQAAGKAASQSRPGAVPSAVAAWTGEMTQWWGRIADHVWQEARGLIRVTRIDQPEAMLIAPEQAFFLRENLRLRLLNARLALMSRQFETAQADLREALNALDRYFDRSSRRTVLAAEGLRQVIAQARSVSIPRPDATLAAIAAAAAGR